MVTWRCMHWSDATEWVGVSLALTDGRAAPVLAGIVWQRWATNWDTSAAFLFCTTVARWRVRYDTIAEFNVDSKAVCIQLNLAHVGYKHRPTSFMTSYVLLTGNANVVCLCPFSTVFSVSINCSVSRTGEQRWLDQRRNFRCCLVYFLSFGEFHFLISRSHSVN